jgi:hypothetical protein
LAGAEDLHPFDFTEEGELFVMLPADQEVLGLAFPASTRLSIRGSFWLQIKAELGGEAVFEGRRFAAGTQLVFGRGRRIVASGPPA